MIATIAMAVAVAAAPAMPARVTPKRVGGVHLRQTHKSLRKAGLVGRQRAGCELEGAGGGGSRAAVLRAPLAGAVELTRTRPRRVKSIIVTRNATARGVVIGDKRKAIRKAYPQATFDTSVEDTFGITLVRVPKGGGGRLQMALDADTGKLTEFGVPYIRFCE